MTDCSSLLDSSTGSSDITSSLGKNRRIRIVRLSRPRVQTLATTTLLIGNSSTSFGFSLRGGREFGTGFFVSKVEKGSEADMQDLRVGDQIVCVNRYHVDDAVHKELSQYISNQDRLILKVRGVGIIPVKERSSDPLTWHIIPTNVMKGFDEVPTRDIRITLSVAPRTKLGCGICKGPEWKPGIFIQFTKEGGIAREAGLQPGDQILSCNNVDFTDILFNEAVIIMKSSTVLHLCVRTGAGLDLFPGESSGYNSSASSVTGDQSPCWGDQSAKRLSIVREESSLSAHHKRAYFRPKSRDRIDLDRRKERLHAVEPPRVPQFIESAKATHEAEVKRPHGQNNTTIIKLSETGTVINNTLIPKSMSSPDNRSRTSIHANQQQQHMDNSFLSSPTATQIETKTVVVEVHRSNYSENIPPPPPSGLQCLNSPNSKCPAPAPAPEPASPSLSNAIYEELKRRAENKSNSPLVNNAQNKSADSHMVSGKLVRNSSDQHNALMDEFKKAHKRMFKNGFAETDEDSGKREQQQQQEKKNLSEERHFTVKSICTNKGEQTNGVRDVIKPKHAPPPPPPPPPSLFADDPPPTTPTPDYDNVLAATASPQKHKSYDSAKGTMGRVAASEMAKANGDAAEMESIESFKLTNPSSPVPRPPSLYFAPQNTGPPTMKKCQRQVSVTIGEYGNMAGNRKEPNKFHFIGKLDDRNGREEDVSQKLKNELEMTLSRSNLKKRNDSMDNLFDDTVNGRTTMILNKSTDAATGGGLKTKPILKKSQSSNVEKLSTMLMGESISEKLNGGHNHRVTISIPNTNGTKMELGKTESLPLNGILKTNSNGDSSHHSPVSATNGEIKNITFR